MAYAAQKLKSQLSVIVLLNVQEEAHNLQKKKRKEKSELKVSAKKGKVACHTSIRKKKKIKKKERDLNITLCGYRPLY